MRKVLSEDYNERQVKSKEEFEKLRAAGLAEYKKVAHKHIDELDSSFVIVSASRVDDEKMEKGDVEFDIHVLSAIVENTGEVFATLKALQKSYNQVLKGLAGHLPEEDMEAITHLLGVKESE